MKQLLLITLLFLSLNIIAQNKIYLDEDWKETSKEKAHFYRILEKKSDSLYYIKDYYINGKIQMDGHISNLEKETLEGVIKWYDENGKITTKKEYSHGTENGIAVSYLANGEILSKGTYKDGEPVNGLFTCDCSYSLLEYKNGVRIKDVSFYLDSKQKAGERYYKTDKTGDEFPTKEVFYDRNNTIIGTLYFSEDDHYKKLNGVSFNFYKENHHYVAIKTKTIRVNGEITQTTNYGKDGKIIYEGTYKNNEPYNGYFLKSNTMRHIKNGEIQQETTFDNDFNPIYELTFKDGKPFEGTRNEYREIKTYKNGKLIALNEYYDYDLKKIKLKTIYSDDKKQTNIYNEEGNIIGSLYTNKDGIKNGLNLNGNIKTYYKNGKILWVEQADFTTDNTILHCDYKNDKPFSGIELDYQDKNYYKDGELYKKEYYRLNFDTKKYYIQKISLYKDNKNIENITYLNDVEYHLKLKDIKPFNGIEYMPYSGELVTYKNGKKEGYYAKYKAQKLVEEAYYTNDFKEGLVSYYPNNSEKTTTCIFKNGQPLNGTVSTTSEKTNYKNGKKQGECIKYRSGFTITSNYVNGIKEGKETVKIGKETFFGIYKNGKEFTGDFFNPDERRFGIRSYKNGKKQGEHISITNYRIIQKIVYDEGVKISEKTVLTYDKSLLGEGFYKKDRPYNGKFVKHIEDNNYSIIKYNQGEIIEKVISELKYPDNAVTVNAETPEIVNSIIEKYTFKNGLKDGEYINANKNKLPSFKNKITGIYKKNKAYSGEFLTNIDEIKIISTYKNGKKEGFEYSETYRQKDSLFYKNGKIVYGKQIESGKYNYFTHYYKNANKIKTEIGNYTITYQSANNFTIIKEDKKNESLKAQIVFLNNEQTKGTISYFEEEKSIGLIKFEKNKLNGTIDYNLFKNDFEDVQTKINNNQACTTLKPDKKFKLYYKVNYEIIFPEKLNYKNYREIMHIFSFKGGNNFIIKHFLTDGTFLSEMKIKNKEPEGIMISYDEIENKIVYTISIKGKNKKIFSDLTYDELLIKLKEIQKN